MVNRLSCSKFRIGSVTVPPFELPEGAFVGLANPAAYDESWYELMQLLAGVRLFPAIHVVAKAVLISSPRHTAALNRGLFKSVKKFAVAAGLSPEAADRAIDDAGIQAGELYGELQLTPRLLLDMHIAWSQGAELAVFSTAGLDPLGIRSVVNAVLGHLDQCSAIDVFSTSLLSYYESVEGYSKIIRCEVE